MTNSNSLIKAIDQAFNMPQLFDSGFPSKLLRDVGGWDSFYTTEVFPYDVLVKTDKDGNAQETRLVFAVAGVDKEDISIKTEYDRLIVSIDQTKKVEDENTHYIRKGLSHRSMTKSFFLRGGVDRENIQSHLENGLLTIILPTEESSKRKSIDIKIK